jgi:hypothetical protein
MLHCIDACLWPDDGYVCWQSSLPPILHWQSALRKLLMFGCMLLNKHLGDPVSCDMS